MPKFAVYYVPEENTKFYSLGTQILGYDVRNRLSIEMHRDLQDRIGTFEKDWVKNARPFGFHLTIIDAIDFDYDDIQRIEREIDNILNCFNPAHPFVLQRRDKDFVTFGDPPAYWGRQLCVLRYDANDYLKILQTLLVARVNPLGIGSGYLQSYLKNPEMYEREPYKAHRTRKFYSPTILDDYSPHFTLLNPYTGKDHQRLRDLFTEMFGHFPVILVNSICLLVQMHEDDNWVIHGEFKRESYPAPLHADFKEQR
ncbi:MAG: hypothetical protein ONB44_11300 [candidate division KSB1 bacterium]|nr:hypothetical protein [candidate division KSB1 bacterium]MDZ7302709.1 hypothetical protein [candidate division KSB1 bacterium]MDZ7311760.1 hypothetical protein [candidate division KSB1 bacterium]